MADPRILAIELDERTIVSRNAAIEQERQVAIADLLARNRFEPRRPRDAGHDGPYRVRLSVQEGRLAIAIADADAHPLETIILGMGRFRRTLREYFAICDSYFKALKQANAGRIEPIDMARRAVHNNGAELLVDCLDGKVALDFDTARRLFTLIAVLHIHG